MSDPRIELCKLLVAQRDEVATAQVFLRRLMELTGAERGYVVARRGADFVPAFAQGCDATADDETGRFSRTLIRLALERNELVHSKNPAEDPGLSTLDSLSPSLGRAVVVAPLSSSGERFGAIYMEHPRPGGFGAAALALLEDVAELAGLCLHSATTRSELAERSAALERDLSAKLDFAGIITKDEGMLRLLATVGQVAPTKASVLVLGESGTGKELVAQALHVNSDRRRGKFVALHCASLPSTMLESELFGHVRGAFTGAERERPGRFASADGGTLFLDEVAEIPLDTQAKLLRAVQFGEVQRLGTDRIEKVDVRIVAATHQDLAAAVKAGRFRQDLYYRLRVVELRLPALRERRKDIALLAQHFVKLHGKDRGLRLSRELVTALERHSWPGNVRELAHAVERACILGRGPELGVDMLPEDITPGAAVPPVASAGGAGFVTFTKDELAAAQAEAARSLELVFVRGLMSQCDNNVTRAAQASGIHRSQLQKMIARLREE